MLDTRSQRLEEKLRAVCPIDGVSVGKLEDKSTVKIFFNPLATQTQKDAANQVLADFDWSPREPRSLSAIASDVDLLDDSTHKKILDYIVASYLKDNPDFAISIGINILGDKKK